MNPNEQIELFRLAVAYLKVKGWEFYAGDEYTEDVWMLPGIIMFEGDNAADRAISWQIENWSDD